MSSVEPLVVMSWAGGWLDALQHAVSAAFERETGVPVRHEINIGLALPPKLLDSLAAGRTPPFEVVWCNSVPAIECAERGWCRPLEADRVATLKALRARAFPSGLGSADSTPVIHPYVVYYVLAYHRRIGAAPRTWAALLDERYANKVAIYPGGNGIYPIAQIMGGGQIETMPDDMRACWAWLERLIPRLGTVDYSIGMGPMLESGRLDLCFRALTNALAFAAEGFDVDWCVPDEGTTDTVDALFVPAKLSDARSRLAEKYVEIATSASVQSAWCARLGAMPVHPDAEIPGILKQHDRLPDHADDHGSLLHLSESMKFRYQRIWETQFERLRDCQRPQ